MALGGKREGAGRKSKAEELGLPLLIEEVIGVDGKAELIRKIWHEAKKGSFQHQQLLAHYMFGKPQDKIDLKVEGEINHIITGMEIV
jgi:2-phosphoglycerate kinase